MAFVTERGQYAESHLEKPKYQQNLKVYLEM